MRIEFLGHASFCIINKIVIYIDPYKIPAKKVRKADLILISHDHFDHFSQKDISFLSTQKTTLIAPMYMKSQLKNIKTNNLILVDTHESIELNQLNNLRISTIPAYNLKNSFHNKGQGVGYIIDFPDKTIYHSGDTDFVDEMKLLKGIDYALLAVGGTYTMNPAEASEFIKLAKPKNIIPMHYGNDLGINLISDLKDLKETCKKEKVNFIQLKPTEYIDIFN